MFQNYKLTISTCRSNHFRAIHRLANIVVFFHKLDIHRIKVLVSFYKDQFNSPLCCWFKKGCCNILKGVNKCIIQKQNIFTHVISAQLVSAVHTRKHVIILIFITISTKSPNTCRGVLQQHIHSTVSIKNIQRCFSNNFVGNLIFKVNDFVHSDKLV